MSLRTVGLHLQCSFKKLKITILIIGQLKVMRYIHTQVYFQLQYSPFAN